MTHDNGSAPDNSVARAAAFAVHLFTASGAALALLAMLAAAEKDWPGMFLWLGLALFVDGIDGTLARALDVRARLPRWSGETLDLVVDILTYVFIPAYAIAASGLFPPWLAIGLSLAVVVTGTLYFADTRMKSADNYFIGFPAVWNVIAFYLLLLRPDAWFGAGAVIALCILTFLPVPFVHPFRVAWFRFVNTGLVAVWSALALAAVLRGLEPGPWITGGLCAIALHFILIGPLLRRPYAA